MAIHVDLKSDDGVEEFLTKWRGLYVNYCHWSKNIAGPEANERDIDKGLFGFLMSRLASLEVIISLLMEQVEGNALSARISEILQIDEEHGFGFSTTREESMNDLLSLIKESFNDDSFIERILHKLTETSDSSVTKVNLNGQWEFLLVLKDDGTAGHVCAPRIMTVDQVLLDLEENGHGSWTGKVEECPGKEDRFHIHLSPKISQYN